MNENDADAVVGLTLAELAFFVLMVVLFLSHLGSTEPPGISVDDYNAVLADLNESKMELAAAEGRISELEAALEDRRSTWRPACDEHVPLRQRILGNIVIQGSDSFRLLTHGVSVDLAGVRRTFSDELQRAEDEECVHSVAVYFDRTLPTPEYERGLNRLGQFFYIQRLGAYGG